MMEALHRGVHAFIPTAMDAIYLAIHRRFSAGDVDGARALHARIAPVLAFSTQHIDISIRFFKHLRHREGVFRSAFCRDLVRPLDMHQMREMEAQLQHVPALKQELAISSGSGARVVP